MPKSPHFTPALFRFFSELKRHNNRDWFVKNKPRYERDVKEPMLRFITDLQPHIAKISEELFCDASPTGGSMFRIYRDVRFSKDKSPYKTYVSASFPHLAAETTGGPDAPGYYIQLDPKDSLLGGGAWMPLGSSVKQIREAIIADPKGWRRAIAGPFAKHFEWWGESLKRPPAGIDPDHPLIDHLKRKQFGAIVRFTPQQACDATFLDFVVKRYRETVPMLKFLASAVDLPW